MPRLDSSAIRKVTYNPKTQKMNVQFVGKGKQYTYVGVPEDVYDDFVNSSSAGKFFNDNIKDDYIAVPSEFVGSVRFDSPDDEDFYEERNMSGKELNEFFGFGLLNTNLQCLSFVLHFYWHVLLLFFHYFCRHSQLFL